MTDKLKGHGNVKSLIKQHEKLISEASGDLQGHSVILQGSEKQVKKKELTVFQKVVWLCKTILTTSLAVMKASYSLGKKSFKRTIPETPIYKPLSKKDAGDNINLPIDPFAYVSRVKSNEEGTVQSIGLKFGAMQELKDKNETSIYKGALSFSNLAGTLGALAPKVALEMKLSSQQPTTELKISKDMQTYREGDDLVQKYELEDGQMDCSVASGYPIMGVKRQGDPIADYMACERFKEGEEEVIIYSGADGSGWGAKVLEAAIDTTQAFTQTIRDQLENEGIKDTKGATHLLIKALGNGHQAASKKTTHLGFIGKTDSNGIFQGVVASVGDQKLFILRKDGRVEDITKRNRGNLNNSNDSGGQLGGDSPDLRNLTIYYFKAEVGDILLPMSDGIHDNLDPQNSEESPKAAIEHLLGNQELKPEEKEFLEKFQQNPPGDWSEVSDQVAKLKEMYQAYKLKEIVVYKKEGQTISSALVEYAYNLTGPARQFLEGNPSESQRDDFLGKMDHLSCAAILI